MPAAPPRAEGGPAASGPLRVALDATPLLGHRTGVGNFCAGVLGGLGRRDDVAVSAFAVSWRRRAELVSLVPPPVRTVQRAMPARPLHALWAHGRVPPLEWFIGAADVVHGTNFVVPPTRRAARVITVHDLTVVRFPELCDGPTLRFPTLIRRAVAEGAWVHTPSAYVAAEVVEAFGARPERVRAVHSGIPPLPRVGPDADRTEPFRTELPAGAERYVLAVGTAEPRKDLPVLVRAFDEIAAERPDLALVLIGAPGWGASELEQAVRQARAATRIVRTGWVSDEARARLLRGAAVLAYPSRYEGFGFPPLEAMAFGVPVVATRAGALVEILGDAAELVAVGDVEALAGGLTAVLDSETRSAALVSAGTARAGAFSWDRCAEGVSGLYRDAVADRA